VVTPSPSASSSSSRHSHAALAIESAVALVAAHLSSPGTELASAHVAIRSATAAALEAVQASSPYAIIHNTANSSSSISSLSESERAAVVGELRNAYVQLFHVVSSVLTKAIFSLFPKAPPAAAASSSSSSPPSSPRPDRVDREGTPLASVYGAYEPLLVSLLPLLTQFCGSKSGHVKLDKHANGVKKGLMHLLRLRLVRFELVDLWIKQMCVQEGWRLEEHAPLDPAVEKQQREAEREARRAAERRMTEESIASLASRKMTEESLASVASAASAASAEAPPASSELPPPAPPAAPEQPNMSSALSSTKNETFSLAVVPPADTWPLRFAGVDVLRVLSHYRSNADHGTVLKIACYYMHVVVTHGRHAPSDVLALCMACYVLAAKTLDSGVRLSTLVTDPKLQKALGEKGLPAFARMPSEAEAAEEFARVVEPEWVPSPQQPVQPPPVVQHVVWEERGLWREMGGGQRAKVHAIALPSVITA
jgi:hypothetical protein